MSCRVLKRGVEFFMLNEIVELAKQQGCNKIVGEYLPTPKNALVKDHYEKLGFQFDAGYWYLSVENYVFRKNYIGK